MDSVKKQIAVLRNFIENAKFPEPQTSQIVKSLKNFLLLKPQLLVQKNPNPELLALAIQISQLQVLYSLSVNNIQQFELTMPRLKLFYKKGSNRSAQQNLFEAFSLLQELSHNRLSQFYFQLERIPLELLSDKFIGYIIGIESDLSAGKFQKILKEVNNPLPFSHLFMERIKSFARYQVARILQKAYTRISFDQAMKHLNISQKDRFQNFIEEQNKNEQGEMRWTRDRQLIRFQQKCAKKCSIEAADKLKQAIRFSLQFERIV